MSTHADVPKPHNHDHALPMKRLLGERLRLHRAALGLTQSEAAKRAGVSTKYYGEIERGEANVTVDVLAVLAETLAWDPWELFLVHAPSMSRAAHKQLMSQLKETQKRIGKLIDWLRGIRPVSEDVIAPGRLGRRRQRGAVVGSAQTHTQSAR